jgi:hypothetical protein
MFEKIPKPTYDTIPKVNIVGFTGTKYGCTMNQLASLKMVVEALDPYIVHHGDCQGADLEFHLLCIKLGVVGYEIHPPNINVYRAYAHLCSQHPKTPQEGNTIIHEEKPYLVRNHDIVDAVSLMIVCPNEFKEQIRSGTWATFRYTRNSNKDYIIIFPDGSIEFKQTLKNKQTEL